MYSYPIPDHKDYTHAVYKMNCSTISVRIHFKSKGIHLTDLHFAECVDCRQTFTYRYRFYDDFISFV